MNVVDFRKFVTECELSGMKIIEARESDPEVFGNAFFKFQIRKINVQAAFDRNETLVDISANGSPWYALARVMEFLGTPIPAVGVTLLSGWEELSSILMNNLPDIEDLFSDPIRMEKFAEYNRMRRQPELDRLERIGEARRRKEDDRV